jgi:hypothetical protein
VLAPVAQSVSAPILCIGGRRFDPGRVHFYDALFLCPLTFDFNTLVQVVEAMLEAGASPNVADEERSFRMRSIRTSGFLPYVRRTSGGGGHPLSLTLSSCAPGCAPYPNIGKLKIVEGEYRCGVEDPEKEQSPSCDCFTPKDVKGLCEKCNRPMRIPKKDEDPY